MNAIDRAVSVGVVGAGTMGAGIAQVATVAGHQVRLYDQDCEAAARAVASVTERLGRAVAKGRLTTAESATAVSRLQAVPTLEDLAGCGLIVEAVVEDLGVKRSLFTRLEDICGPDAVLASNTSSLSVTDIATGLARPGRVAGLHFFNPAPVLPLVEVVAGEQSDARVIDVLVATAEAWGKTPVRARSSPGFIVNRVARPFYGEAFRLLGTGRLEAATIDTMLRESGGFPMGPFELADLIGHDVNLAVSRSVWEAFGRDPRFEPSELQQRMVDEGRLGRKTGRGIYVDGEARPASSTAPPRTGTIGHWAGTGARGPMARMLSRRADPVRSREGSDSADDAAGSFGRLAEASATRPHESVDWQIGTDEIVLRLTDGRTAAQHTGGGPRTVVLADLALDYEAATRIGIAAPEYAPAEHVEAVVGFLQGLGYTVTVLPDTPGLVVARTVAMLAAFATEAVDAGVADAADVDLAMRLGVNYPRGPFEWGQALGWTWVAGVLDALAAAEDPQRYRVSPGLRSRAENDEPGGEREPEDRAEVVLAQRAADAMWAGDAASQALGMNVEHVSPGQASVTMRVRPDMVNGHGICHGGLVFSLADTAFAFACNSHNRATVAQSCDITFIAPAREGDLLLAVATERHRGRRSGIYDVSVTRREPLRDESDDLIAEFRGRSREISGSLVENP